ncbi:MAG: hypothetical protein Q4B43_03710 [Bacteroidota bacterium]|nr:hypothetical protein [Bacteroidota bacterium]
MDYFNSNQETAIILNESIKANLKSIVGWSKFLAILGFVVVGIMVLSGIFMILSGGLLGITSQAIGGVGVAFIGFGYILVSVFYYVPLRYLYRFSTKTESFLNNNMQNYFEEALENLKSHYKFIGIFTIVTISLYILAVIGAVINAAIIASKY